MAHVRLNIHPSSNIGGGAGGNRSRGGAEINGEGIWRISSELSHIGDTVEVLGQGYDAESDGIFLNPLQLDD